MNSDLFYFEVCHQRRRTTGHRHYHNTLEFYFLEEGRCSYLINDKLYGVEQGDLVVIPKQVIHSTTYTAPYSRLLVNCADSLLDGLPFPKEPIYRNSDVTREIRAIFTEIKQEYRLNDPYSLVLLQSAMQRLLILLERNPNLYSIGRDSNHLIENILRELNTDFSGNVTLEETAHRHYVSSAHLSRTFKQETGMNFNEYLSLLRLKMAEQLLRAETRMSISEIAFACGFNDSNYFSKKFHDTHGCSPSAFSRKEKLHQ